VLSLSFAFLTPDTARAADAPCDYPLAGHWPSTGSWRCEENNPPEKMPPDRLAGNYCVAFGGVSFHGKNAQDEESITLQNFGSVGNVPAGDTIERAYILWSGRAKPNRSDDPTIEVLVGDAFQPINADLRTEAFSDGKFYWHAYRADITDYYRDNLLGSPVTLKGLAIGTADASDEYDNHGIGIIVIYENVDRCPYQDIALFYGNDVLYQGWDSPSGPNSEVACIDVPRLSQATRFDFQMFVGGIANEKRSDSIWFASGHGAKPTRIAPPDSPPELATVVELQDQFQPLAGVEFDSYESSTDCRIPDSGEQCESKVRAISPYSEWLCFQIQSPIKKDYPDRGKGISAAWLSLVVRTARAGISIQKPEVERTIGQTHIWTVTVESTLGLTATTDIAQGAAPTPTILITPTVVPPPTSLVHSCASPNVAADGIIATCTIAISSNVATVYTATATAKITQMVDDKTFTSVMETDGATGNSGPAVVTYIGGQPVAGIAIETAINGDPADGEPGPLISIPPQGTSVIWSYTVTNTGGVALTSITVINDKGEDVCRNDPNLPPDLLAPKGSFTCSEVETAKLNLQQRIGAVTAEVQGNPTRSVDAKDSAFYTGVKEDWGDAPDPASGTGSRNYATKSWDNGPRHRIVDGLILGERVDSEGDGQPTPEALGDDLTYQPDEDSLIGDACLVYGRPAGVTVRAINTLAQTNAQLYGWLDFNDDGVFSQDERASVDVIAGEGSADYPLLFTRAPANSADDIFLRLRLSSDSAAAEPTGLAIDGEVEDHRLELVTPTLDANANNNTLLVGETVTITGTASASCGLVDQLRVCFDVENNNQATKCFTTQSDGRASYSYSSDVAREDQVQVWIDLNRDERQDNGEPAQSVPIQWLIPEGFTVELAPKSKTLPVGATHTVTATLTSINGLPVSGRSLLFMVDGVHPREERVRTDANGQANLDIYGRGVGGDKITVRLQGADGTNDSATVTWVGSYTVTLDPAGQRRIVGTDTGPLMIKIAGKEESPIEDLSLYYQVSGLNSFGPAPVEGRTDENGELVLLPYHYSSDANHLGEFDKVVVGVTDAISAGFVYTGAAWIEWVPISMTITPENGQVENEQVENEQVENEQVENKRIKVSITVSNTQQPLSGEVLVWIREDNLVDQGPQASQEMSDTVKVETGRPGVTVFPIEEKVRKFDNLIYPGCDIAFFDQSEWTLAAWADLNRDQGFTGEEPTCIVEQPTAGDVSGLAAQVEESGVRLAWRTASEFNILGFNLLRSLGVEQFEVVNATPIMAEGGVIGATYEHFDTLPAPGIYRYQLETVFLNGVTSRGAILTVRYPEEYTLPIQLFLPTVLRP